MANSSKGNTSGRGWRRAAARARRGIGLGVAVAAAGLGLTGSALAGGTLLPLTYSIVPTNGDANPYGVVIPVQRSRVRRYNPATF